MNVKFNKMHGHMNVKFNKMHGHMNVKFENKPPIRSLTMLIYHFQLIFYLPMHSTETHLSQIAAINIRTVFFIKTFFMSQTHTVDLAL